MFTKLALGTLRYRKAIVALTGVVFAASAFIGGSVADRLSEGGFDDPGSDSVRARAELDARFDTGFADMLVLVSLPTDSPTSVDGPDAVVAGVALTRELAELDGLDDVVSYWNTGDPGLRSVDGRRALVLFRLPGAEDDRAREDVIAHLSVAYGDTTRGPLTVEVGGREAVFDRTGAAIEEDLALAEAIAIPATFILLVLIFGGVVAALLPVGVGVVAAIGTFLILHGITTFTDVSIFALNLVTALGLGLAIDYSLLIVKRVREERRAGRSLDGAVIRTIETAGRTIVFSGITVAISLATLLVFPLPFLRSFAYAGVGVVTLAVLMSVVVLPALLRMLGDRLDGLTVLAPRYPRHAVNRWREGALNMVARPWTVIVLSVALLVLVATPFLGVSWGEADHRSLPAGDPVRNVSETIRTEFDSAEAAAFPVLGLGSATPSATTTLALELSQLAGVGRVESASGVFRGGAAINPPSAGIAATFSADDDVWFRVVPTVETISPEAETLIATIRAMPSDFDEVLVGGGTAAFVDTKAAIIDRVWIAAALIALATFVLLFLMFNSVLVPLKAIALNLLSLGATFGMMVWIFQEGHGADFLGFTPTGQTDITTPILMFCIAFGLSMDYEVFLLSRIREEYDRTGDNRTAVIEGLARTGGVVTSAAILLAVTFLAFATSGVATIKLFGLGLAVAVLVDAFVVRLTLVPALMTVAGRANWWAPAPLRRLHARIGLAQAPDRPIDLRDDIDLRPVFDLTEDPDGSLHIEDHDPLVP